MIYHVRPPPAVARDSGQGGWGNKQCGVPDHDNCTMTNSLPNINNVLITTPIPRRRTAQKTVSGQKTFVPQKFFFGRLDPPPPPTLCQRFLSLDPLEYYLKHRSEHHAPFYHDFLVAPQDPRRWLHAQPPAPRGAGSRHGREALSLEPAARARAEEQRGRGPAGGAVRPANTPPPTRDTAVRLKSGRLLTPPAPPLRHSLVVVEGIGDDTQAHQRRICTARRAGRRSMHAGHRRSATSWRVHESRCGGGLGEPPSLGLSVMTATTKRACLSDDSLERRRKRGSLGAGIVGLWRETFW
ncbi:hypothetical protein GGX14DRAFT_408081 [Mycena pura]|uniref:Uncharacterized protein n=1 Tax=Mycena pura TaxID=153505 RepID=A0AAD6UU57_9AGAR|nr:hypothetical protein GGX14DRAFT_408081 [Mycena pura]